MIESAQENQKIVRSQLSFAGLRRAESLTHALLLAVVVFFFAPP